MKSILQIKGMHCVSCQALLEEVIGEIPGVTSCRVDIDRGMAEVEHEKEISKETFEKTIVPLGEYRMVSLTRES